MQRPPGWEEFQTRYYRWALDDWRREIWSDFELIRVNRSSVGEKFLRVMRSLSRTDQLVLAAALVKRFHPHAVRLLDDPLAAEEARILAAHDRARLGTAIPRAARVLLPGAKPEAINKRGLSKGLRERLRPIVGDSENWGKGEWRHTITIHGWQIHTFLDLGAGTDQLVYDHAISASGHRYLIEAASVFSWLGVASQTKWDLLRAGDEEEATEAVETYCRHFMNAVSPVLEGLPHPGGP